MYKYVKVFFDILTILSLLGCSSRFNPPDANDVAVIVTKRLLMNPINIMSGAKPVDVKVENLKCNHVENGKFACSFDDSGKFIFPRKKDIQRPFSNKNSTGTFIKSGDVWVDSM